MCPSEPVSQPQAIDNHADDTEMVMQLPIMMHGAPPSPENVLTDVDPHEFAPWNLPLGDDTDAYLEQALWQILEEDENNHRFRNSSNTDADLEEENNSNLHNSSNVSPALSRSLRPDRSAQHLNEGYDFSTGEYLEDNDLIDSGSSSSLSEYSCFTSENSEECFNPDALLQELENPVRPDTDLESSLSNVDCMLSVAASQGSHQVLIQPGASGSIGSCSNEMSTLHVEETADSATMMQGSNPVVSAAAVVEEPSERGTAADEVMSQEGPSNSQDAIVHGKRKAVGRLAKLKKKYFCFIP